MTVSILSTVLLLSSQSPLTSAANITTDDPSPVRVVLTTADTSKSADAAEGLVESVSNWSIAQAVRYGKTLRRTGTPDDQLWGFTMALTDRMWMNAIQAEDYRREGAVQILELATSAANEFGSDPAVNQEVLDVLDAALTNAFNFTQIVHTLRVNERVDEGSAKLEASRPWYWFNDTEGEREAGRIVAPAQRDSALGDLKCRTRIDGFIADATDGMSGSELSGYLRLTGLDTMEPIHTKLIPRDRLVWDYRTAHLDSPEQLRARLRDALRPEGER